jgi:rod shape-determining protein MreC
VLDVRRRTGFLLVAVIVGQVVLISAQVTTRSGTRVLEAVGFGALAQIQRAVSVVIGTVSSTWTDYASLRHAREENEVLRREVGRLQLEVQKQRELAAEGRRLAGLLEFRSAVDAPSVAARVIARDPTLGFLTITIDKGTADGLAKDMAVLSPDGVVGRVLKPGPNVSMVQLIVDRSAAAGAMIERSRAAAVVAGSGGDPPLRVDYMPNLADVKAGDLIITSGLDGIYPKGFPIGRVERVERGVGLYKAITVRPVVDFSRLEEVLVVLRTAPPAVQPEAPE